MSRSRIRPPRNARLAALVAACAIGAAGCGSGSGGAPATDPPTSFVRSVDAQTTASGSPDKLTVRVAYIGDYSLDEASALVAPGYQGASLAAKAATAAGTLPVNLEVVSYTTDGDPQKALEAAGKIAADPQIVGVIIAPFTLESKAVGEVLDAAGLATVSLSSMDPTLSANGWANWRRIVATGAIQARALASFAGRLPAARKGVCLSGDDSARSLALERVAASQLRGRVSGRVTLAASDVAATQAASAVRRTGCGVVLWTGSGAQAAALRLRLSASERPVALVATDDTKTDAYLAETGRAGDGTVVACSCVDLTTSPRLDAQRFINAFQFDIGAPPGPYAVEGWDAGNLFVDAVSTGATTRTPVAAQLRDVHEFDGLAGRTEIGPHGELVGAASNIRFYRAEGGRWLSLGADDGSSPFTLRTDGVLTVGSCRWGAPFAFRRDGRLRGFDVEIAHEVAARMRLDLRWRRLRCGSQVRALKAGRVDALASTRRPVPRRVVGSRIYLSLRQALTIDRGAHAGIHEVGDLRARDSVGVIRGSAGERWARRELAPKGIRLDPFRRPGRAFRALGEGSLDAVVADEGISRDEAHSGRRLAVAHSLDVGDYQVFAVSRRNPGLLATIDAEVSSLVRSRAYRRAFARWFFGSDVPPETVTP